MTPRRLAHLIATLSLPVLASGCIATPTTSQSERISDLYLIFVAASAVVLAIVWSLLTWSVIRYRKSGRSHESDESDEASRPPQIRGNVPLEVFWTTVPALTVAVLFFFTFTTLTDIQAVPADPAVRLKVTGFQWGWHFEYPDEGVEVTGSGTPGPEIVLPVDAPIELTVTGADVIHSFYVPEFLVKYDAIPGHEYTAPLRIEEPGIYAGQCAEFCGLYHDQMAFTIRAVSMDEYHAWIEEQRGATG